MKTWMIWTVVAAAAVAAMGLWLWWRDRRDGVPLASGERLRRIALEISGVKPRWWWPDWYVRSRTRTRLRVRPEKGAAALAREVADETWRAICSCCQRMVPHRTIHSLHGDFDMPDPHRCASGSWCIGGGIRAEATREAGGSVRAALARAHRAPDRCPTCKAVGA